MISPQNTKPKKLKTNFVINLFISYLTKVIFNLKVNSYVQYEKSSEGLKIEMNI